MVKQVLLTDKIKKTNICSVRVNNISMQEAIEEMEYLIKKREQGFVVIPNVDYIIQLQKDLEFRKTYNEASLVLPDGMPIMWAAKFLGTLLKEKISSVYREVFGKNETS